MTESDIEAISVTEYMDENWDFFGPFQNEADNQLTEISRKLPAEFHEEIQYGFLDLLTSLGQEKSLTIRLVIDTNIILQDAFRVGQGKPSTTERILSSPYVTLCAPSDIHREVEEQLEKKIPKGASVRVAKAHAKRLLSHVRIVEEFSKESYIRADSLIGEGSPEDVSFLAVAFDTSADAIVSRDKRAFDSQFEKSRWELSETVDTIVSYESGMLSVVVIGTSIETLFSIGEKVLITLINSFFTILDIFINFVIGILNKSAEHLAKVPSWAWFILAAIGIGTIVAAIASKEFREFLADGINNAITALKPIIEGAIKAIVTIYHAFRYIIIGLWNFFIPVTSIIYVVGGVLLHRIINLLTLITEIKKARHS